MRARMRTYRWALLVILTAAVALGGSVVLTADAAQEFPHEQHARLFPLCEGCHAGIPTGDEAEFYPAPQLCGNCHDGVVEERVDWTGPTDEPTNLRFTHLHHQRELAEHGEEPLECAQCHTPAGASRMTIVRADPPVCLSCHAHRADDHYVDAECAQCHVPFVQSELPPLRLATLPVPDDHGVPDFILEAHGEQARSDITRCAVCHTRERCETCHVNAADVASIGAMPAAPHDWVLPQFTVAYPTPPSHLDRQWIEKHGPVASRAECAACHTQESCTTCHVQPVPEAILELPRRGVAPAAQAVPAQQGRMPARGGDAAHPTLVPASLGGAQPAAPSYAAQPAALPYAAQDTPRIRAPGVMTERKMPLSHASRFFEEQHGALAASQPGSCAACHERTFCSDCHETPAKPVYHPRNFQAQHASAAYGRRLECSTCHEVRTFCRSCHIQQGMETQGRLNPGFHDAEPLWLLRHARAARQGLESCTSCHRQRDCLQCHSEIGAFQVSPHGPDFDARRAQRRNAVICFACHVSDPLGGTLP
jgi:predicted CXXCH cytochrome family protein